MNIHEPSWKSRYNGIADALELPLDFSLHSAVEGFFRAEALAFEHALSTIPRENPQVQKFIDDFVCRVADPFFGVLQFESTVIPALKRQLASKKSHLAQLKDMCTQSSDETKFREDSGRFLEKYDTHVRKTEALMREIDRGMPRYQQFVLDIAGVIQQKDEERLIVTARNYLVEQESYRNGLYRAVLQKEETEILGWDIRRLNESHLLNAQHYAWLHEKYSCAGDSVKEAARERKMKVVFPQPLGEEQLSADFVYQHVIPSQAHPEMFERLQARIDKYFNARKKSIFDEKKS